MRTIVAPISLIATTESRVADCMPAIWLPISSVALAVCVASSLHLRRDHGKAAAGLAGARRLDGGVERQQIGLLGDGGDQLHHVADASGRRRQLVDPAVGHIGLMHRRTGDVFRFADLAADLADRCA